MRGGADAGEHENLRRIDRAGAQNDLASGTDLPECAALPILHADGAALLDDDTGDEGIGLDREIGPAFRRIEERTYGAVAASVPDRAVGNAEAFGLRDIEIVGLAVAHGLRGLDKGREEHRILGHGGDMQGAGAAMPGRLAAPVMLGPPEIGQHVVIAPSR